MKLYGLKLSEPREEDRYFIVLSEDERRAKNEVTDRSDGEVCSIKVMSVDDLLKQFDGCVEVLV